MQARVSLSDDLRQHGENILRSLATVTLVIVTVSAIADRDTNYNSSRDYLLLIGVSVAMLILFEGVSHLRHRKRLLSHRAAS